jgi:CRP-like cAMP-binding protein
VLTTQGKPGKYFFLIMQGEVEVCIRTITKEKQNKEY